MQRFVGHELLSIGVDPSDFSTAKIDTRTHNLSTFKINEREADQLIQDVLYDTFRT